MKGVSYGIVFRFVLISILCLCTYPIFAAATEEEEDIKQIFPHESQRIISQRGIVHHIVYLDEELDIGIYMVKVMKNHRWSGLGPDIDHEIMVAPLGLGLRAKDKVQYTNDTEYVIRHFQYSLGEGEETIMYHQYDQIEKKIYKFPYTVKTYEPDRFLGIHVIEASATSYYIQCKYDHRPWPFGGEARDYIRDMKWLKDDPGHGTVNVQDYESGWTQ